MIFVTTYRFKAHLKDEELSQVLAKFMEHGEPGETIGHYQAADHSCGVVLGRNPQALVGKPAEADDQQRNIPITTHSQRISVGSIPSEQ